MRGLVAGLVAWATVPLICHATEPADSPLPLEVAKLKIQIDHWRSIRGIRAEAQWKVWMDWARVRRERAITPDQEKASRRDRLPDELHRQSTTTLIADGCHYRISEQYDKNSTDMAGESFEAALDAHFFQFLQNNSRLQYGNTEDRVVASIAGQTLQLEPLQFICGTETDQGDTLFVSWPDLANDKLIDERLHMGVVGTTETPSGKRPTVTFPCGKMDGKPISYRLYVDGPAGQPSQIDYVNGEGKVIIETKYEYSNATDKLPWPVPVRMSERNFYPKGQLIATAEANATKLEINPDLEDDAFTIDITDVNHVYDMDANKTLKGYDWEMREAAAGAKAAHQPPLKEK